MVLQGRRSQLSPRRLPRLALRAGKFVSFFCSRDFEDKSNLQAVFPTLAFQLVYYSERSFPESRGPTLALDGSCFVPRWRRSSLVHPKPPAFKHLSSLTLLMSAKTKNLHPRFFCAFPLCGRDSGQNHFNPSQLSGKYASLTTTHWEAGIWLLVIPVGGLDSGLQVYDPSAEIAYSYCFVAVGSKVYQYTVRI